MEFGLLQDEAGSQRLAHGAHKRPRALLVDVQHSSIFADFFKESRRKARSSWRTSTRRAHGVLASTHEHPLFCVVESESGQGARLAAGLF